MKNGINKQLKTRIIISWLLVILWAGVIFYFSSKTAEESTVQSRTVIFSFHVIPEALISNEETLEFIDGIVRESAHGIEYLILGVLMYNALFLCLNYRNQEEKLLTAETGIVCTDKYRKINCFLCAWIICCIYAVSDEIHQIPVPGRTFQLLDLIIDFSGSFIGILIGYIKSSFSSHRIV